MVKYLDLYAFNRYAQPFSLRTLWPTNYEIRLQEKETRTPVF